MPERLRNFVARTEFHVFVFWLAQRGFRTHAVVLQITVAVFVDQNTAFTTAAFSHQDTGAWQTCWVILNEFHITQRNAVAQRHAHTVAGYDAAVGVVTVNTTCAARCHNNSVSTDLHQRAFHHVHGNQAASMTVVNQDIQNEVFVKALNLRELQRCLEQRMQHVEAGLIRGKPGTLDFHAAEATYVDATVFTTAPWAAPLFQLRHFSWAVVDKVIHDILLTQPVSACYRIVKMVVKAVMILRDSSRAAFGSNGMAAHWVHF